MLVVIFLTVFIHGCVISTPDSVYYTLIPSAENNSSHIAPSKKWPLSIGIGPIKFPSELDRPEIVTRSQKNRLLINEFHRWGGSLESDFLRILTDNLRRILQTDKVMVRPWEQYFTPEIRLSLDVHQFDGRLGEYASLKATWAIYDKTENTLLVIHHGDFKAPIQQDGYDALVEAQSTLVMMLSKEISKTLFDI
nr:PqiC family protein [Desulfogranum marinum]